MTDISRRRERCGGDTKRGTTYILEDQGRTRLQRLKATLACPEAELRAEPRNGGKRGAVGVVGARPSSVQTRYLCMHACWDFR
jgi:hypothetical protein